MKLIERIKKAKENKKGFTLVELIVVLVILAILAAILIPTLTGYIDKANEKKIVAEGRMVLMAAQTALSENYKQTVTKDDLEAEINLLAEKSSLPADAAYYVEYDKATSKVTLLQYTDGSKFITYTAGGGWGKVQDGKTLSGNGVKVD